MLPTAVPKPLPRWRQKQIQQAAKIRRQKAVYAAVDARDGHRCRICKRPVTPFGLVDGGHHHHLVYRSRGGADASENVVLLDAACHQAVHDADIRLSGNADLARGVKLERHTESGWQVDRWV